MIDLKNASAAEVAAELLKEPVKAAAVASTIAARLNLADLEGPLSDAIERVKKDPAGAALRALFGKGGRS